MGRLDGRVRWSLARRTSAESAAASRELAAEGEAQAVVDVAHEEMGEALAVASGGRFYLRTSPTESTSS
jgi:hypothetical protein